METMKKGVRVGEKPVVYDMEKLYGHLLVLGQKRDMDLEEVFKYELSPVPSALFDEYGQMRKTSKAVLIKKLGVQALPGQNVEVQLIDGNEMLYNIVWPKAGKVHHLADIFLKAVTPTQNVEADVIFDKYDDAPFKTHERNRRAGNVIYPSH